jgi:uncharacterized protein YbjQ (UPF0145 family)
MAQQPPVQFQLPPTALARLQMASQPQSGRRLFTSDLSVNEFVLVKEAGFEPLGLVMGSSVYHIGFQVGSWNQNMELQVLTQAMYAARELAMARMQTEADALGADGIVGVRLLLTHHQGAMSDFVAIGTAIRARDQAGAWRTPAGRAFTSDLSGQDFWTLRQAGYVPVSLVLGTCVYHIAHQSMRQAFRNVGQNIELPNFTQATYDARELAMSRMQGEAERDQADGIVGVRIGENAHVWGEHATEFLAIGTSVRQVEQKDHALSQPMVLPITG